MSTINEMTDKIFSVNYEKCFIDDSVSDIYEGMAEELIANNKWVDVYSSWYDYLINKCKTEEEVLNFANLFWCYEGYKQFIPNAVEFCAFFYANISPEHYPDAAIILDSITYEVFLNSGIYPRNSLYFDEYIPMNDSLIKNEVNKWKKKRKCLC